MLFSLPTQAVRGEREKVRCRVFALVISFLMIGGLLKYYECEAA